MHPVWNNVDFSVYTRLRRHMWFVRILRQIDLISADRFAQFAQVSPDVISWNLQKGIPFGSETFDVVYHSHLLEHIDRDHTPEFLRECFRVLRPGGVIRVVVPDLEKWANVYNASLTTSPSNGSGLEDHHRVVSALLVQLVDREPTTRKMQKPVVRFFERQILGDSARVGWQHRWMYDRFTLAAVLERAGFSECRMMSADRSRVNGWNDFGLDTYADGREYKPESIWVEAVRQLRQ